MDSVGRERSMGPHVDPILERLAVRVGLECAARGTHAHLRSARIGELMVTFPAPVFGGAWEGRLATLEMGAVDVAHIAGVSVAQALRLLLIADGWYWSARGMQLPVRIGAGDVAWTDDGVSATVRSALRES